MISHSRSFQRAGVRRGIPLGLASILLLLLLPGALHAEGDRDTSDFGRTGIYLRGGAAIGFENSRRLQNINRLLPALINSGRFGPLPPGVFVTAARLDVDPLLGVAVGLGYRLHPHFAVEGAFDWMRGDITRSLQPPLLGLDRENEKVGSFSLWTATGNLKGYLFTGRIQPYAVAGLGAMRQELRNSTSRERGLSFSATAFVVRFGAGLDIYLTRSILFDFGVGYLLGTGDLASSDAVSLRVGVGGRF